MSALSTKAIKERLIDEDPLKRLVVCPLLDDNQVKPGQSSIDIRLGFEFCLVSPSVVGMVDEFSRHKDKLDSLSELYRRQYVPLGDKIVIHPHQFMLAQTLEYLKFPPDLMAYVVGRSTWGRLGLIVATAVGIHPNFAGSLTLELRNLGETPLALYPGQSIAQLFVHTVKENDGSDSVTLAPDTQYVGRVDMVPRKISSEPTRAIMEQLIEDYQDKHKNGDKGAVVAIPIKVKPTKATVTTKQAVVKTRRRSRPPQKSS